MAETEFDLILAYCAFWCCLLVFAIRSFMAARSMARRTAGKK